MTTSVFLMVWLIPLFIALPIAIIAWYSDPPTDDNIGSAVMVVLSTFIPFFNILIMALLTVFTGHYLITDYPKKRLSYEASRTRKAQLIRYYQTLCDGNMNRDKIRRSILQNGFINNELCNDLENAIKNATYVSKGQILLDIMDNLPPKSLEEIKKDLDAASK